MHVRLAMVGGSYILHESLAQFVPFAGTVQLPDVCVFLVSSLLLRPVH